MLTRCRSATPIQHGRGGPRANLAARSHGVVTRAQLLAAGITRAEIKRRLRTGALLREHPGVYRVGHRAPSVEARYLAAVWACGDGAVLSGRAAAHLWGLIKGPAPRAGSDRAERSGGSQGVTTRPVAQHRGDDPPRHPDHHRPPHPRRPRSHLSLDALARACHEAGVKYDTTPQPGRRRARASDPQTKGAAKLREILHGDVHVTLSKLERDFLARLEEAGLPLPKTNKPRPRPPRRLPLARAPPDRRARQLPLPPLAPRVGAGPPARARGARPRRRVPPLHLRRRHQRAQV